VFNTNPPPATQSNAGRGLADAALGRNTLTGTWGAASVTTAFACGSAFCRPMSQRANRNLRGPTIERGSQRAARRSGWNSVLIGGTFQRTRAAAGPRS
jgi:hypothetical protein